MVAYSFQRRFVEPIRTLRKRHTIRGPRHRHGRPGEAVQLYAGMRTRHCEKIMLDPVCRAITPVHLDLWPETVDEVIQVDGTALVRSAREQFAIQEGFADLAEMRAFWRKQHGRAPFDGFIVAWEPAR